MNQTEFIDAIKIAVKDNAIEGIKSSLRNPPGRHPSEEKVELSKWYNNLSEQDKRFINQIITNSVESALFGFLCVLDGVRSIESYEKGELKLFYEKDGNKMLLNDFNLEYLHDLFMAV